MQNIHNFVQVSQGDLTTVFELYIDEPRPDSGISIGFFAGSKGRTYMCGNKHKMIDLAKRIFEDEFPDVEILPDIMECVSFPANGRVLEGL